MRSLPPAAVTTERTRAAPWKRHDCSHSPPSRRLNWRLHDRSFGAPSNLPRRAGPDQSPRSQRVTPAPQIKSRPVLTLLDAACLLRSLRTSDPSCSPAHRIMRRSMLTCVRAVAPRSFRHSSSVPLASPCVASSAFAAAPAVTTWRLMHTLAQRTHQPIRRHTASFSSDAAAPSSSTPAATPLPTPVEGEGQCSNALWIWRAVHC